jgi:hypothetical protein
MSLVMIKCPHTARPISTGIEVDDSQFILLPDVLMRCDCPVCGMNHTWWKREAWLADYAGHPVTEPPPLLRPRQRSTKL